MYQSSSGELRDVKFMETTYLTNALSKTYREVWNSTTAEQYTMYTNNINVLRTELDKRIHQFNLEKIPVIGGGN